MAEALIAGHICLDIIPELGGIVEFEPGRLVEAGPAVLSTGGAVSNTGLALTRLGVETQLVGKIGTDHLGEVVRRILENHQAGLGDSMAVMEGETTSYTVVLNLSGKDRMFLHCPGCNNTFIADDVPKAAMRDSRLLHFGYPPLMAKMFAHDGRELATLFRRAKEAGCTTSLDMSLPDIDSVSGHADWTAILAKVLPYVDVFMPSIDELLLMLERPTYDAIRGAVYSDLPAPIFRRLAQRALDMGASIVGIKAGNRGLYVRSRRDVGFLGRAFMMNHVDAGEAWRARELWSPCFRVDTLGTTGAGDATIAGFLMAIMRGMDPERAVNAATAVGACSCEQPDAVSGVVPWDVTRARMAAGWDRLPLDPGESASDKAEWIRLESGVWERFNQ